MQKICDIYNYFYLHKTQEKVLEVRYKSKKESDQDTSNILQWFMNADDSFIKKTRQ